MKTFEVNFDGLVGPTHHYGGLAFGNVASAKHAHTASNPREAAKEGLRKMKFLMDLGCTQAVLPPQLRPDMATLRRLGFSGSTQTMLDDAWKASPALLANIYSASSMWAANAATVSPGADTADGRVHFTPANLCTNFHRSLEPAATGIVLKHIFAAPKHFVHHDPLPATSYFSDEGAANHTRFANHHGTAGLGFFVYGFLPETREGQTKKFPARQSRMASEAIARQHGLKAGRTLLMQQLPAAIDAGVFHNDVIAVGNENVLLYHEQAFADEAAVVSWMQTHLAHPCPVRISAHELSLEDAVATYLFNSQLVTLPEGGMALVAPKECEEHTAAAAALERIRSDNTNPIGAIHYVDVRGSMRNGGGPACLRLRVVLTEEEIAASHQGVYLTPALYETLMAWVEAHYRDRLVTDDLRDPRLLEESTAALDALAKALKLSLRA